MNELTWILAGAALRVTVVAAAAGVLVLLAARRRPRLAAGLASLGLGMIVGLSFLAFCPLPAWWTWDAVSPRAGHADRADRQAQAAAVSQDNPTPTSPPPSAFPEERPWFGVPVSLVPQFWRRLSLSASAGSRPGGSWLDVFGLLVAVGVGIGLVRLLLGLVWVSGCHRRGRPLHDAGLLGLLEDLRGAMGCRAPVEVLEVRGLGTAGTVGWRRPLVLLPQDWRTWTEPERRAVLAHELAHVCRSDYLSGLLARLGVALHFYHPLVWWLAGRLRLQQELAADALGARFGGGRGPYLAALASLALRQDGRALRGPARAFLPARGMLLRRVTMLRSKEVNPGGGSSAVLRLAAGMLLVATGVAVSALRLPAGEGTAPREEARPERPTSAGVNPPGAPKPFDLSYLPPDGVAIWAFRPAAVFRGGVTRLSVDILALFLLGNRLDKNFAKLGLSAGELDEVFGGAYVLTNPKAPEGQRYSLAFGCSKARTIHPFDWKGKLERLSEGFQTVPYAGTCYYKTIRPIFHFVGNRLCFFTPDDRTIVFDTEENIRRLLDRGPQARPAGLWMDKWHQVEGGVLALAVNHRHPDLVRSLQGGHLQDDELFLNLIRDANRSVWGVDFRQHFQFRIFVECTTEPKARSWKGQVNSLVEQTRDAALKGLPGDGPGRGLKGQWGAFVKAFYDRLRVERKGKEVQIGSEVQTDFPALLDRIIAECLSEALKGPAQP